MGLLGKLQVWLFGYKATVGEWGHMWARLYVLIPTKVLAWLDEGREKHQRHPLLYIMTLLIVALAVASMWNFITRAYIHHAGISAYMGGAALAGLVPITVFFAVYAPITDRQRGFVWVIAGVFVTVSALIQFPVYAEGARLNFAYVLSAGFDLEALAFGVGNPLAECLLAVMEAMYLNAIAKKEAGDAQQAKEAALAASLAQQQVEDAAKLEAKQLQEKTEQQERDRLLFAEQQEQRRLTFELDLELKKAEALAKIERERIKAEAKLASKSMSKLVSKLDSAPLPFVENTPVSEGRQAKKDKKLDALLAIYSRNPELSYRDAGKQIGVSKDTVGNYLKELADKGKVDLNGVVKVL